MAKIVLHIGTHKTATTTVQDTFWKNSEALAKHGLIYPQLSLATGHHGLVSDWGKLPAAYDLEGGSRAAFRRIAETYAGGDHTVFLSSEELSRCAPTHVDFAEIRELLSAFDEIEVMVTLRPQWEFLQSIYLEVAKKRSPPRPPEIVAPAVEHGVFAGLWIDYSMMLSYLLDFFNPDEITLVDFETAKAHPGGILGYYLEHLGIDLAADALETVNQGTSNVSPLSLASWAANLIAEPQIPTSWLIDVTTGAFAVEFGANARPCLFSRAEFAALEERFAGANAELAERVAAIQPGFALTSAPAPEKMIHREDIGYSYWMRCNRRMFRVVTDGEKARKRQAAAAKKAATKKPV